MGIFDALTSAVTGLQAQSFALQNISGNIANSQTTAFKRVDTSFSDLVPDSAPTQQVSGGVLAQSRATNNVQGAIQAASVSTYMGINGDGYFIVQKPVVSRTARLYSAATIFIPAAATSSSIRTASSLTVPAIT